MRAKDGLSTQWVFDRIGSHEGDRKRNGSPCHSCRYTRNLAYYGTTAGIIVFRTHCSRKGWPRRLYLNTSPSVLCFTIAKEVLINCVSPIYTTTIHAHSKNASIQGNLSVHDVVHTSMIANTYPLHAPGTSACCCCVPQALRTLA